MHLNKIFGPKLGGYTLQDSGNYFMDNVIYFHNLVLCILFFIVMLVTWFLITTLLYFGKPKIYQKLSIFYTYHLNYSFYLLDYYLGFFKFVYVKVKFLVYLCFSHFIENQILQGLFFTQSNSFCLLYKELQYLGIYKYSPQKYITYNLSINSISFKNFIFSKNIEYRYYFYSDVKLEFIWTLFPSLILLILAIPSFGLLFSVEKVSAPELTVKVIGHQWYWEYQYMDYINYKEIVETANNKFIYVNKQDDNYILESYMINDEDLLKGQYRLLEVDKKLILPIDSSIRLLITSDDVLHSWAVPSLGIKVDACPGRINEIIVKIREIGVYYGQCSELCGWYHGFMPIVIQSLNQDDFKIWALSSFLDVKYIEK